MGVQTFRPSSPARTYTKDSVLELPLGTLVDDVEGDIYIVAYDSNDSRRMLIGIRPIDMELVVNRAYCAPFTISNATVTIKNEGAITDQSF